MYENCARRTDWHDGCIICCAGDHTNVNRPPRTDSRAADARLSGVSDAGSQEPILGPATADREHRSRVGAQADINADPEWGIVAPENARERDLKPLVALSTLLAIERTRCTGRPYLDVKVSPVGES